MSIDFRTKFRSASAGSIISLKASVTTKRLRTTVSKYPLYLVSFVSGVNDWYNGKDWNVYDGSQISELDLLDVEKVVRSF